MVAFFSPQGYYATIMLFIHRGGAGKSDFCRLWQEPIANANVRIRCVEYAHINRNTFKLSRIIVEKILTSQSRERALFVKNPLKIGDNRTIKSVKFRKCEADFAESVPLSTRSKMVQNNR